MPLLLAGSVCASLESLPVPDGAPSGSSLWQPMATRSLPPPCAGKTTAIVAV